MENINGTSPASFRWVFLCATMGLAASAPVCFAQEVQNASHETAITLATLIAAVSAVVAVIGAVIASRIARAVMKSAAAMMSAPKKHGGMLPPPITITANGKIDWATYFIGVIETPLATVLTILFSIALGVGLNLLLSRTDPPSALVPASKPAVQASAASVSAPPPSTSTAAAPATAARVSAPPPPPATATSVSAPPPPISTAAAPDHNEIAGLVARGLAYLSDGDIALARVFLRRAAERNDPHAALALGGTYDPAALKRIGIPNFQAQADPAKAREWYRRAADLGSTAAASHLDKLSKTDR